MEVNDAQGIRDIEEVELQGMAFGDALKWDRERDVSQLSPGFWLVKLN